ncbi:MAG: hypothetical protein KatS3mg050_3611 [Litorilinea sp.]|nr:MAG: hypothetical protein KatS3mg050_3611 [Litorilinea sp.]
MTGDRTRFQQTISPTIPLGQVTALSFEYYIPASSVSALHPDYTPALRLHVFDPGADGQPGTGDDLWTELVWEGAYNGVYGNLNRDQWYTGDGVSGTVWRWVTGQGVTLDGGGAQVNLPVPDWADPSNGWYTANAVVFAISVGVGSSAGTGYHAFADTVILGVNGDNTTYNFEAETPCTAVCYVDGANGDDSFGGDTPASAKRTIQAAVDQVDVGGQVIVAAGVYTENVTIGKRLSLIGAGSDADPAGNTVVRKAANAAVFTITGSGNSLAEPLLLQDIRIEPEHVYGINIPSGTVQYLTLDNVQVIGTNETNDTESETGLKVATAASLHYLTVMDSAFDHLTYGWYFAKHGDWGPGGSNVTHVSVSNTSFSYNDAKGIYVEKLSDATFTNCQVINNGVYSAFWNGTWNAGFDINLKGEEIYQNIVFDNVTFMDNGHHVKEGAALMIKARDDGATYGAHPASLDNVQILNSTFQGNERGIRLGEPGANNAGPTNVVIHNNNIISNTQTYTGTDGSPYGGVINLTQSRVDATMNWWGAADGPSGEGSGSGDAVSANVDFCPWLDGAAPGGAPASASGGFATTSSDGHTSLYCTIEAAMYASTGPNQEVHVQPGQWPAETMNRDYTDSPGLLVRATGSMTDTVIHGLSLGGASFDGLTFQNFTFTGDHPDAYGNYHVAIDSSGVYTDLAFIDNTFDGQDAVDIAAFFTNQGWNGLRFQGNTFRNYHQSLARPDGDYIINYSLIFAEAQGTTPGDQLVLVDNRFEEVHHLNAAEAYRWRRVAMENNQVTGIHGRLLIWSDGATDIISATVQNNSLNVMTGTVDYQTTGIGVYYLDAPVTISGNTVQGASTCLTASGIEALTVTGNQFSSCATRGLLFSDSGGVVTPAQALIQGNTFADGPLGVENQAESFELNVCENTFTNIAQRELSNPGPFARCTSDVVVTKVVDWSGLPADPTASFELCISGPGYNDCQVNVAPSQTITWTDLWPGTYVITETAAAGYSVAMSCDNGASGTSLSLSLVRDQDVTCQVTNTALPASLTITKTVVGPAPDSPWTFTGSLGNFTLPTIGGAQTFSGLAAGSYVITETTKPGYQTSVLCDNGVQGTASVAVTLALGEHVACEFVNTAILPAVTITKTVVGPAPDSPWTFTGNLGDFTLPAAGGSQTFANLQPGSYIVQETSQPGYTTHVTCDDGTQGNNNVILDLALDEHVRCEFVNTAILPTVTVVKRVEGLPPATAWAFSGDLGSFTLPATGGSQSFTGLQPGTYTIQEASQPGYTTRVTCDDGSQGNDSVTLNLALAENVTCEFVNSAIPPTITITKTVVGPAPDSPWTFTGSLGNFVLPAAGGSQTFTGLQPGSYTITETVKSGYHAAVSCDNGATGDHAVQLELAPGDQVACTFVNTAGTATVVITKTVVGPAPDSPWTFTGSLGDFTLPAAGGSQTFANLQPGTYTIRETGQPGYGPSVQCDNGAGGADSITVSLKPGQVIGCEFTNSAQKGTLVVTKLVEGEAPESPWQFTGDLGNFTLPATGGTRVFAGLEPGSYQVQEAAAPGFTGSVVCDNGTSGDTGVTVQLSPGASVACTFVNRRQPAAIELQATVGVDPNTCGEEHAITVPAGTTVYYCYTVTNRGASTLTTHDLEDSQLGTLFTALAYELGPGESISTVDLGQRYSTTVQSTVASLATWSAYSDPNLQVHAVAQTLVNVGQPAIDVVKTVGTDPGRCSEQSTLVVAPDSEVYFCVTVVNTGNVTFTHVTLEDPLLGVTVTIPEQLAPGATATFTRTQIAALGPVTVTANMTNTVTVKVANGEVQGANLTAQPVPGLFHATDQATAVVLVDLALQEEEQVVDTNRIYLPLIER